MSCEIQLTATLEGVSKFLDWEKSGGNDNETDDYRNTVQNFKISISPSGEIIVFAKSSWILICGSKWDSCADGVKTKYSPNWHGHINCKPGEEITAVLCLPFFSQGHSIRGCADWTCIVLGFSSGCIRFYTEAMQELVCSILHDESITDVKCFCLMTSSHSKAQRQENPDIYVLYKSVICVLNGSLLSQVLQNKRNQLARSSTSDSDAEVYTPLEFRKYSFVNQEEVNDACYLGQTLSSSVNTFDHLVTASLVGGFYSNFKSSPPQTSLIVTSGRKPFVGFHYTFEGGNSPVLTDVALAVASKIKNSFTSTLPDWFGFGSKKSQPEKPKEVAQNYAEKLNCRFGLCDLWRQGQSVIVSPTGEYSLVTDSLGRVLLIENAKGVALRLWKGYRDAQCGFLQVQEDLQSLRRRKTKSTRPQPRQGLFAVIYAPKKGLIEIFSAQHGQRISSFKMTKFGRLLYVPREQIRSNVSAGGFYLGQNQVIFISQEGLKEFSVPFHCALVEDNGKMSRDLHILRKMKMLIKMENGSPNALEDIEKCARDLKTDEVRLQAVESLVTYKNTTLEAFKVVLQVFLEDLQNKNRTEQAPRKLVEFSRLILNLLLFYEFVSSLKDKPTETSDGEEKQDSLSEVLRLPEKELEIILKFVQQIKEIEKVKKQTTKVAFEEKKSSRVGVFLSCFDFETLLGNLNRVEKPEEKKGKGAELLGLKTSDKDNKLNYLGEVFFEGVAGSSSSLSQWKKHAENCGLNPAHLALCLLSYWCNKNALENIPLEMHFLVEVLQSICSLSDTSDIVVEYNSESSWWKRLRTFIADNPNSVRGLLAALCCRSVTIFAEQERELEGKTSCDVKEASKLNENLESGDALVINNEWETISKDTCQWDILITQLQDVALLNAILNLTFRTENKFPAVPFDFEHQCLSSIQANGTGRVSELVAKWLVQFGFKPSSLVDQKDLEFQKSSEERDENETSVLILELDKANEARGCDENLNLALDYLALLKSRFPYSLTSSSLLGNMCWEYIAYWFKNIKELNYLEAALEYLKNIPSCRIKYGISFLTWNTYLMEKFETLAKMMNRIGKVPHEKLCTSEIGLRKDQVLSFLQMVGEFLKIISFSAEAEDKSNFGRNREAIWQNTATPSTASLVFIALSQPVVNGDLISFQLQISSSLLLMAGLGVRHSKLFSSLFDIVERVNFTLNGNPQLNSHHQYRKLKKSRTEFLKKCLSAAVQTVEVVEFISPVPAEESAEILPTTELKVEEYKKWLQICYDLANVWVLSVDDLRRHQICELYSCGFDRLAEEVISSVNKTDVLASQLLVLGGKRLKYLIQDSKDFYKRLTKLSANLSEWLHTLDLEDFTYHGSIDDIEVLMRYSAKWLPEDQTEHKLAIAVIESLAFLRNKTSDDDGDYGDLLR